MTDDRVTEQRQWHTHRGTRTETREEPQRSSSNAVGRVVGGRNQSEAIKSTTDAITYDTARRYLAGEFCGGIQQKRKNRKA